MNELPTTNILKIDSRRSERLNQTWLVDIREALKSDPESDRARLSVRVHLRLAMCRNLLMREARQSVERWGLTLPQFDVLAELARAKGEGFTFGELSQLLLVTSGNLTGIVDHLEGDGLARRKTDDRDRRVVRIVLTRKGRKLIKQVTPEHAGDIGTALVFMSDDQLRRLEQMLRAMGDGLQTRQSRSGVAKDLTNNDSQRRQGRRRKPILRAVEERIDPSSQPSLPPSVE